MKASFIILLAALAGSVQAQHMQHPGHGAAPRPYAGMQDREIKALSAEERAALLEGQGMGLALAAELNGYPGPVHVLELGDARGARIVEIRMSDQMRFAPDRIEVREGETVRFVVRNRGKVLHEMVIGTPEELRQHAALMKKFPKMEHDEPYMTHVKPARKDEIVWNFNRAGTFQFACLIPGHFDAGMLGTIVVTPATQQGNLKP